MEKDKSGDWLVVCDEKVDVYVFSDISRVERIHKLPSF